MERSNEHWNDANLPDQRGRRAVVTGASSGIGVWTALQLAAHGADVVVAGRNRQKIEGVVHEIEALVPRAKVRGAHLDLADLASVRAFAEEENAASRGLDLLINNAGVALTPEGRTRDGFETQLGINHLGHFALTGLLLPALLRTPSPRVVAVASDATRRARIDLDDLQSDRHYDRWSAYARSKLANLLFIRELARRSVAGSVALLATAAHPGFAATGLGSGYGAPRWAEQLATRTLTFIADPPGRGALPTLYAATMPVPQGSYWGPGARGGGPAPAPIPRAALDAETAERLWRQSEELTGVTFAGL